VNLQQLAQLLALDKLITERKSFVVAMQCGVEDVISAGEQYLGKLVFTYIACQRIHIQASRANQCGDVGFISELVEIGQPGVLRGEHQYSISRLLWRDDVD